ncbi:hypothetical protein [uncultured Photobacterium sp.]|uniref:hypothetical protein n=1 Tax=uncultured Photobacterium sp. TaxID=173973 RepID=UPI002628211A|nr:hypothetical protein [uncultured Photobacterium sp.]
MNKNGKPSGSNHPEAENKPKKNTGLNITLQRLVEARRYPVIAQLTFKQKRADLVSLLKATQQNPETMPPRLMEYLKREKLWDSETVSLTPKGKEVVDTGYVDVKERGLYHIWYTHNDPLLGIRPLLIQRDTAFFEPNCKPWKSGADARNSEFGVSATCTVDVLEEIYGGQKTNSSRQSLTLVSLQPEILCSPEASAHLSLEWRLGFKQSEVSLKGQLESLSFSRKKKEPEPIKFDCQICGYQEHLNTVLGAIANKFDGFWSESAQRMVVSLEEIHQYPQAIQRFEVGSRVISRLSTDLGTFDSTLVFHLPIKPRDHADAEHWHQDWLNHFHSKSYRRDSDTRQQQSLWLDHEAMADFDLTLKSGQELLDCFGRESQPESYWHVAAMADLSPSRSKKQRLPITLINSEVLNIRELIGQLTAGDSVQSVIYSDRYVHTSRQNRNLNSIASYVEGAEGLLMTLNPTRGSSDADLPENWERHILDKQSDNHGRYWVFIGASHTWCWECTSGLDFICKHNDGFIVDGTPSFIPKDEDELPHYLKNTINKKKKTAEVM